tara:strand:+ start:117 stop:563 length:447 start_codon:yes stop_codon:yes gene_type:complete
MTLTKRKKSINYRGSKTHGCGSMKKRRGAGNRGGRGLAGSGKRAGHKVQQIVKRFGKGYLGKYGFTSKSRSVVKGINLKDIEIKLNSLMEKGLAKKEGDKISIDLEKLGYNKLLGSGLVKSKFKIKTKFFSRKAKEKLEKIGGEIVSG